MGNARFGFASMRALVSMRSVVSNMVVLAMVAVLAPNAAASVPLDQTTSGNGNVYLITDSVSTATLQPNSVVGTLTTNLGITGDDDYGFADLPFAFQVQDVVFGSNAALSVSANGFIAFGDGPPAGTSFANVDMAALTAANDAPFLAPFWDDLNPADCSDGVYADTFGTAPSRVFVVEWRNVCAIGAQPTDTDGFTFQARLFETSHTIEYHYADVEGDPGPASALGQNANNGISATVGVSAGGASSAGGGNGAFAQYSYLDSVNSTPLSSGGFAVRFQQCPTSDPTVTTAEGLDRAITCYNFQMPAGDHTITLGGDIAHPGATPPITQSDPTHTLTIEGAGHAITGPGDSIPGEVDLITHDSPTTLTLSNLTLSNAEFDAVVVFQGLTKVTNSTIQGATNTGILAVGLGALDISNSMINGNGLYGVEARGGNATISNSTIETNDVGVFANGFAVVNVANSTLSNNTFNGFGAQDSAVAAISNSTIEGNQSVGVLSSGTASVIVSNSTVLNNTIFGLAAQGTSTMTVSSSIIDDLCANLESGMIRDGRNNFVAANDIGCGFTKLGAGSLAPGPAENGGPTKTVELLAGSNAIGRGDCTEIPVAVLPTGQPVLGDLDFDQRGSGFDRTVASICDAGAFEVACTNPFVDVPGGRFYTEPAIWAACNGVTTGTTATTFAPSAPLTRAQMATFLWRFAGEPEGSPDHPFADVPDGRFFTEPVKWLFDQGITTGTTATTFNPNGTVTRAQMAAFIWRFAGEPSAPPNSFTDVPEVSFYTQAVDWMAATGVTTGTTATTYSPFKPLTRGEAVTFLLRLAKLE